MTVSFLDHVEPQFPRLIEPHKSRAERRKSEVTAVRHIPHWDYAQLSDREYLSHITDCHLLMQLAKARYRGSKSLADATEAAVWAQAKADAEKARQEAAKERDQELTFAGEWVEEVVGARRGGRFGR
jgi:hypothetical protein